MQQTTKRLPASSPCNPPPTMLHIPFLKQRYICVSFLLKDIPDGSPLIQFLFLACQTPHNCFSSHAFIFLILLHTMHILHTHTHSNTHS